jgi:hypothetical protein
MAAPMAAPRPQVAGNTTKTIGVLSEGAKQATGRVAAGVSTLSGDCT